MISRHLHWTIVAWDGKRYNKENPDEPILIHFATKITVIGYTTEETAINAAKAIISRDNYNISEVLECNECGFRQSHIDAFGKLEEKL